MLRRILSSEKIVKGEGRIKYRNLFQIFFIPRRILSYVKIVKGEGKRQARKVVFQLYRSFLLDSASQRGVTLSVIPHPDAVSRKSSGRRARKIHFLFTFLSGPASQRGVTLSVIPHPDAVSRKRSGKSVRQIHFLLRPTLDPASQRGVTRSHTAPRCGIQKMLERESPQDTFPFASLSGPRVAARGDVQSYRTPMRYPEKARAGVSAKYIPFYVPLWTPRRSAG